MGEGNPRDPKRTATIDPREIARLAKQSVISPAGDLPAEDGARDDLADEGRLRAARGSEPPLTGRTVTLDDPLTTSLLAEITRSARTLEMSPEQLDAALARAAATDEDAPAPREDTVPSPATVRRSRD